MERLEPPERLEQLEPWAVDAGRGLVERLEHLERPLSSDVLNRA